MNSYETAAYLISRSLRLVPMYPLDAEKFCACGNRDKDHKPGKHPKWTAGNSTAHPDHWLANPADGVGIDREASRVVTVEDDDELARWTQENSVVLDRTFTMKSPSDRLRLFYRLPEGFAAVHNWVKPGGAEVDILAKGRAPGPGVRRPDGEYKIAEDREIADAPQSLVAWLEARHAARAANAPDVVPAEDFEGELPEPVARAIARDDPDRSGKTYAVVMACYDAGLTQGEAAGVIEDHVPEAAEKYGKRPGGTDAQVAEIWAKQPGDPAWFTEGREPGKLELFYETERDRALAARRGITEPTLPSLVPAALVPGQFPPDPALAEIAARYAPVDWHQAFKAQPDDVDWLFYPLLERGTVNAMFAAPGTGKSLLAEDVSLEAARDGETVLYVDDENRVADLVERFRDMGAGPDDLDRIRMYSFAGLPPLDTPDGGLHLLALAVANGAALVVLDTTTRMVAGRENDSDTFLQLYRCSLVALKQRGVTVLRLDHPGKDTDRGQRGSSAKDGDVDTIWKMTEVVPESVFHLERTKSRNGHGAPAVTVQRQRKPLRHSWSPLDLSGVTELEKQLDDLNVPLAAGRDAVRAALKTAGVKVSNSQLSQAIRHRKQLSRTAADSQNGSTTGPLSVRTALTGADSGQVPDQVSFNGVSSTVEITPEMRDQLRALGCQVDDAE